MKHLPKQMKLSQKKIVKKNVRFNRIIKIGRSLLIAQIVNICLLLVLSIESYSQNQPQTPPPVISKFAFSKNQYLTDFDALVNFIRQNHVNPFWQIKEESFNKLVNVSRNKIANQNLKSEEVITEYLKVLASIKDGHSSFTGRKTSFALYPFKTYVFPEGVFITETLESQSDILGSKIIKIDGVPIAKVLDLMRGVVPHCNEQGFMFFLDEYLSLPVLLYGLGITKSANKITLTLQQINGQKIQRQIEKVESEDDYIKKSRISLNSLDENILPYYRMNRDKNYWFTYIHHLKTFYVGYNQVGNMNDEPIPQFIQRLEKEVNEKEVDKFILDIRNNGGGNNFLNVDFVKLLVNNQKINQSGKFFTIIGRNTFSAAIGLTGELENRTKTIFVGEPIGDAPLKPGDARFFTLPNTGLRLRLSSLFWISTHDFDKRLTISPTIPVTVSFKNYLAKKDPVMDSIFAYKLPTASYSKENEKQIERLTGRYSFGLGRTLEINYKDNSFYLSITGDLHTKLFPTTGNKFLTKIPNLYLQFSKGDLTINYPNGSFRKLEKNDELYRSAFELVFENKLDLALDKFEQLKTIPINNTGLSGNNLTMDAIFLYAVTGDLDKTLTILKAAVNLNPTSEMAKANLNKFNEIKLKENK